MMLDQDDELENGGGKRAFDFVPEIELPENIDTMPRSEKSAHRLIAGQPFGNYKLIEEIGRGSMGVVFKARHTGLDRLVALKTIRAGRLASEADVRRFVNESQAAAQLHHVGIVPVFEVGCENGAHFFAMQFIEGTNLTEIINEQSKTRREMLELFLTVCEAVAHCHRQGIIHRDLKPSNILIDEEGKPKVTDFGLARNLDRDSTLTATGDVMGTPGYMPPEQAFGDPSAASKTVDVYSLGAILYHILTGRPPILARDVNLAGAIQLVRDHDVVAAKYFDRKIHRDLDTICSKCLQKNPQKRYADAGEMAADLKAHLEGENIQARGLNLYSTLR